MNIELKQKIYDMSKLKYKKTARAAATNLTSSASLNNIFCAITDAYNLNEPTPRRGRLDVSFCLASHCCCRRIHMIDALIR